MQSHVVVLIVLTALAFGLPGWVWGQGERKLEHRQFLVAIAIAESSTNVTDRRSRTRPGSRLLNSAAAGQHSTK